MSLDQLRKVVIVIVTVAWTASLVLTALDRTYNPPGTLHVLMVAVVTFLLGAPTIFRTNGSNPFRNGKREKEEKQQ